MRRFLTHAAALLACLGWLLMASTAPPVRAAGEVTFTVTVKSAYLRAAPADSAVRSYSVFRGSTYAVIGRTGDSAWIRLDYAGATQGTWILASYGTLAGDVSAVPVEAALLPASGGLVPTAAPGATAPPRDPASAGYNHTFTITAKSTYVRDASDWGANRIASLFLGQVLPAAGRNTSGEWVQLLLYGGPGWVPAYVGKLDTDLLSLPVVDALLAPPPPDQPASQPVTLPAYIPVITPRMKAVYQQAPAYGRSQRMFAIIGDCNSERWLYQDLVAKSLIDLRGRDYLWPTILQFKPAFYRESLAISGGFNAASVLDPVWSDPQQCRLNESPFDCELRVSRASIVIILLGTGDQYTWQSFEVNYRALIEDALKKGALPVVVTKLDSLEFLEGKAPEGHINDAIRRLAAEYEVPLLDFAQAAAGLTNRGLTDEPGHDFHLNAEAIGVHVIATLQTLYAIWRQ